MRNSVSRHLIGRGDSQTLDTLVVMREVANDSLSDPTVIEAAVDIVRGVDGRDSDSLAVELLEWLESRIRFLPDPLVDGDFLRTPRYLLREVSAHGFARGDCDDAATLSASLAKAIGLPARFVVLAFNDAAAPFAHVFTQVRTAAGWVALDVTETELTRRGAPVARALAMDV